MTNLYAFTYKINDMKHPTEEDYENRIISVLRRKYKLVDFVYEQDRKGKLHVHGVVDFFGFTPRFATMVPRGVHSRHVKITSLDDWQRYMLKDQRKRLDNKQYLF